MQRVIFRGNERSAPVWMAEWAGRHSLALFPAKVDPTQFTDKSGIQVVVGVAGAAQGATTIPVAALAFSTFPSTVTIAAGQVIIPAGSTLDFGGAKFARLTADALLGATSLTVAALPTALVSGDTASFQWYGARKFLPSGTLVGRTFAERDANTPFGPATVASDDEIFLTAFDLPDMLINNDVELVRPTARIYENYLPGYATLPGGDLTKIRALYQCSKAVN